MESLWPYSRNGFAAGPVSSKQLARLIMDRQVSRTCDVCDFSDGLWKPVSQVREIMQLVNQYNQATYDKSHETMLFKAFMASGGKVSDKYGWYLLQPLFSNMNWKTVAVLSLLTGGLFQLYWFFLQGMKLGSMDGNNRRLLRSFSFALFLTPLITFVAIDQNKLFRRVKLAPFNPYILSFLWYASLLLIILPSFINNSLVSYSQNLLALLVSTYVIVITQKYINDCNFLLGVGKKP